MIIILIGGTHYLQRLHYRPLHHLHLKRHPIIMVDEESGGKKYFLSEEVHLQRHNQQLQQQIMIVVTQALLMGNLHAFVYSAVSEEKYF